MSDSKNVTTLLVRLVQTGFKHRLSCSLVINIWWGEGVRFGLTWNKIIVFIKLYHMMDTVMVLTDLPHFELGLVVRKILGEVKERLPRSLILKKNITFKSEKCKRKQHTE